MDTRMTHSIPHNSPANINNRQNYAQTSSRGKRVELEGANLNGIVVVVASQSRRNGYVCDKKNSSGSGRITKHVHLLTRQTHLKQLNSVAMGNSSPSFLHFSR